MHIRGLPALTLPALTQLQSPKNRQGATSDGGSGAKLFGYRMLSRQFSTLTPFVAGEQHLAIALNIRWLSTMSYDELSVTVIKTRPQSHFVISLLQLRDSLEISS